LIFQDRTKKTYGGERREGTRFRRDRGRRGGGAFKGKGGSSVTKIRNKGWMVKVFKWGPRGPDSAEAR